MAKSSKEQELTIKIAGKVEATFKNALKTVTSGIGTVTKAMAAATTAAAAAVGTIATAAVNVGKEFETSMSQVSATMLIDKTTEEGAAAYETLENAARECGRTTAFSATEAADALNYLALAGYDATQAADALPTVLNLAGAGAMDLATASDMVTDSMSALNIEATKDNLSNFADQMAMTASKANTTVSQLGEAILTVGATGANLAGGTTELNTALGILADNGAKGAEGGTHLRNVILSLQAPTEAASAALAKYTNGVYDSEGNMRSLQDIFKELSSSMENMTQAEKDAVMNDIFNKTDLASANALLANSSERWDQLSESINNAAGACEDMYNVQLDNLDGDIKILKSGLSDLGISIYKDLNGPIREIVQLATGMVEELSNAYAEGGLSGMVGAIGGCLSEGIDVIADYIPQVLKMGMDLLQSFIDGIVENADSIGETGADIVLTFATGASEMLPKVADAAVTIITSFANSLLEGDNLTIITQAAINAIAGFINAIVAHLPEIMQAGKQIIAQLISGILSGSDGSIGDIATRFILIAVAVQPLIKLFTKFTGVAKGIFGVVQKVSGLFGSFGSTAKKTLTGFNELGSASTGLSTGLKALTENATGLLALGAAILMVSAGMTLLSVAATNIANSGPGAAAALVLLVAAIAGLAVGAAALAPALAAGAVGLVAFGAGVALVGVGILAATGGIALLATQLPNIATYGAAAAEGILLISASLVALSGGAIAAAAGLTALFIPMVGGIATTAALGVALVGLSVSAGVGVAAMALLVTTMTALNVTMISIKNNAGEAGKSIQDMSTGVDVISTGLNAIQSIASDAIKAFVSIFQSETPTVSSAATTMMSGLTTSFTTGFTAVKAQAREAANAVKAAFENLKITIPKPKIPVITATYKTEQYGNGGNIQLPQFSVNWNAQGGIFDKDTVMSTSQGLQGAGEAGPEALIPLDTLWSQMRSILTDIINNATGQSIIETLVEKLQSIGASGGSTDGSPELAGAGGGTFTYSPVYNLYGTATKEDVQEADKMSQAEFAKLMKEYEKENKRTKF